MSKLNPIEQEHAEGPVFSFYVGTYTHGDSEGIYKYLLHSNGSITELGLQAKTENPSWLAVSKSGKHLFAVNEIDTAGGNGLLEAYLISEEKLELSGRKSSGGAHPCFLALNETGFIATANYTGGNIALHKYSDDGSLSDVLDLQQHTGSSVHERQDIPHAHSCWFEPGTENLISLDLGTDQVWFSALDAEDQKIKPLIPQTLSLPPGSGPRHLCFHPHNKWSYIVNEINSTVTLLNKSESGEYSLGDTYSTLPEKFNGENTCSHIQLSSEGAFLYVTNRGYDSIAVFKVSFADGSLKLLGQKSTGGKSPRSFSFSPDENYILVANQLSDNVVILKRNKLSGMLKYKKKFDVSAPACIEFVSL